MFVMTARFAPLVTLATALALAAPAVAADHQRIPIGGSFPISYLDECTGETVAGTLEFSGHIDISTNAQGRTLFGYHEVDHATLVGQTTGTIYVSRATIESTSVTGGTGATTSTLTNSSHLLARGAVDNLDLTVVSHLTVNANGDVTSDVLIEHFACRG
jgi:hypothetical protein